MIHPVVCTGTHCLFQGLFVLQNIEHFSGGRNIMTDYSCDNGACCCVLLTKGRKPIYMEEGKQMWGKWKISTPTSQSCKAAVVYGDVLTEGSERPASGFGSQCRRSHTHTHKTLQQSSSSSLHRNIFTSCELWVSWNLGWQALSFYLCLKWQWSHTGTKTNQSGSSLFQTRTWHHPIFTEISQIHVSHGSMMVYNGLRGQAHLAVVSINIWANHICDSLV